MFVLKDLDTAFMIAVAKAMTARGIYFTLVSDDKLTVNPSETAMVYLCEVDKNFNLNTDKNFVAFLKKNKFKRAVITILDSSEFAVESHLNGSITILRLPSFSSSCQNVCQFYVHTLIELSLRSTPNLPSASQKSNQLINLIKKIAATSATVLVNGPTGTGKELISNLIHYFSDRKNNAFVAVNCAAIPDQMLESILFGHEKGAFTGAVQPNQGLVRAANGGTILLDEISEMPISLQSKLLRVIQEKKVLPIGSAIETDVDVRIIATTNRNMFKEVKAGNFREDLFYRLNVFPINSLSLVERLDDIVPIVAHMLTKIFNDQGRLINISEDGLACLQEHAWPGNVRELSNLIQRAVILCDGNLIKRADLIFDTASHLDQPNTAEILAAKFKADSETEVTS